MVVVTNIASTHMWYPRTEHQMVLFPRYKHPKHAQLTDKPLVDSARPYNPSLERDYVDKWNIGHGAFHMNSLDHFVQSAEQVAYTNSYSSFDFCKISWCWMNLFHANYSVSRVQQGNLMPSNPRSWWAHRIVYLASVVRLQVAFLVGVCGYFYVYEFCYTYVPYLRIRDPSPEGWKKPWQTGQTTFGARFVASFFPAIAHMIYRGQRKRSIFWFSMAWSVSWWYEWCRPMFTGTRLFYGYRNASYTDTMSRYGSLIPDAERRNDPDTNKPFHAANYEHQKLTHGLFQEDHWANWNNEHLPLRRTGCKFPNPRFNFQKAAQCYRDEPLKYKSDLFNLHNVLSAHMLSGANDGPMTG